MVRKKTVRSQTRKSRRKKQTSGFVAAVRKVFFFMVAVIVCSIVLLFMYDRFYPREKLLPEQKKETAQEEVSVAPVVSSTQPVERVKTKESSSTYSFPAKAEIPTLKKKQTEQIIQHEGYTVSYNSDYKIANWVAYELTDKEAKSNKNERSNKFVVDPMVKGASATNEDYTRTGYDRGHLAPAGDMKWSYKAMNESFYLSNICPQKPGLNRGIWKDLEEQARLWASENGSLLIVTGPVIEDDLKRLGKNRVGIPRTFYKVICTVTDGQVEGVGFLFDNKDYGETPLKSMMIPIDSVEHVTGIDFFPSLPDSIEDRMEARVNKSSWSF